MDAPQPNPKQQIRFPLDPASVQILATLVVSKIVAGSGISISPATGVGAVTITNASSSASIEGRSYLSSNQSLTSGTPTKVPLDTNTFANGITWDSANHRLTCLTAGNYLVTGMATLTGTSVGDTLNAFLYKNGGAFCQLTQQTTNGQTYSLPLSDIVALAVTDYLELYVEDNNHNCTILGSGNQTYLSTAKV